MSNHDTHDPGDGGAAAIVAGLLVVVAIVLGVLFYVGVDSARPHVIDLDVKPPIVNSEPAK